MFIDIAPPVCPPLTPGPGGSQLASYSAVRLGTGNTYNIQWQFRFLNLLLFYFNGNFIKVLTFNSFHQKNL